MFIRQFPALAPEGDAGAGGGAPAAPPAAPPAPPAVPPPAAPSASPAPAPAPVPAPPAPARPAKTLAELLGAPEPDEASRRLVRAGRKALRQFGIDIAKSDDIEKKAEEWRARREQEKEERKALRTKAEEADRYATAVSAYMKTELAGLSEEHRQTILAIAGNDPAAQLSRLTTLRAHGIIKPKVAESQSAPVAPPTPAPAAPAQAAAPPPIPPPATSAPPQPGPVPTSPTNTDLLAQHKQLKTSTSKADRGMAAILALRNADKLLPE